ncbi:MAG: 16S rRNA processing protein RimM [Acidobacteria bacterium]|nr:16S rRNA processing protein RimM [Acidobacteriota bacterium]
MSDLVAVAKAVRPRGLKGELVCDLLTDFPERFEGLDNVTAVLPAGERPLTIESHWFQAGRIVLKFAGVDNVDSAEELRGADICVGEDEAVELDEGEFFDWQLEGCRVEDTAGVEIGIVKELMRTGGTDLLVVIGEREHLIPFAEAICTAVDVERKLIVIDPPDGLLEF